MVNQILGPRDGGLFLDFAAYSIVTEGNAAQYYPDYAYGHALFTQDMAIHSDSKISSLLQDMRQDASALFLNDWNRKRDRRQKIYISYDWISVMHSGSRYPRMCSRLYLTKKAPQETRPSAQTSDRN